MYFKNKYINEHKNDITQHNLEIFKLNEQIVSLNSQLDYYKNQTYRRTIVFHNSENDNN